MEVVNIDGIKFDKDKPEYADFLLDFREPLQELYKVWEFGKKKYGKSNWKFVEDGYRRYSNALIRHFFKNPSNLDEETGLYHAAHMAFNCLAMIKFILDKQECPTTPAKTNLGKNILDEVETPLYENPINLKITRDAYCKVKNKKTGKIYYASIENPITNATNEVDGQTMIFYYNPDNPDLQFVREESEFYKKFEIL